MPNALSCTFNRRRRSIRWPPSRPPIAHSFALLTLGNDAARRSVSNPARQTESSSQPEFRQNSLRRTLLTGKLPRFRWKPVQLLTAQQLDTRLAAVRPIRRAGTGRGHAASLSSGVVELEVKHQRGWFCCSAYLRLNFDLYSGRTSTCADTRHTPVSVSHRRPRTHNSRGRLAVAGTLAQARGRRSLGLTKIGRSRDD